MANQNALKLARLLNTQTGCRLCKPDFLESFYIEIPIPFKRGDLLEYTRYNYGLEGNVFVLKKPNRYSLKIHKRLLNGGGDTSDMIVDVFCYKNERGMVYCGDAFYLNLRYCRHELENEMRILKYISMYLQDKICLCDMLKLQRYLPLEKMTNDFMKDYDLKYTLERIEDKLFDDN